jgi:hypothetical protein
MNRLGFGILIPLSKSVVMSRITRLLFVTTSDSLLSILIALDCAFAIAYTFVDCCTSTCISMDSCNSALTMFSSHVSFYVFVFPQINEH